MQKIMKQDYVLLDFDAKDREQLFEKVSRLALEKGLVENAKTLVTAFEEREDLESTAFEDGFAIPHARSSVVQNAGVFFVRLKKPIIWDSKENKLTDIAIMLVIPEGQGNYLDILSGIAQKLMVADIRKELKTTTNKTKIIDILTSEQKQKEVSISNDKNALSVVGVSACATGVVHTYMARDALLDAGKALNWNVSIETQGQKGQEFALKQSEIDNADAVILAADINIDLDRFGGKKVYKVGTKTVIADPQTQLRYSISKGKVLPKNVEDGAGSFDVKKKGDFIAHIMNGISFMIPFIVFAGIIFAIVTGIGKLAFGNMIDYSGTVNWETQSYTQSYIDTATGQTETITVYGFGILLLYSLNSFAGIGFTVMMPIMGAYIAYSIAGRATLAPAFVLTFLAANPAMWLKWGPFVDYVSTMQGLGIFGALIFGFLVGYTIKWINKQNIHSYIQPIMPIIIIPVFVSLVYGLVWILILGNVFGLLIGWLYEGLNALERSPVGMAAIGFILGAIAGVDMGGPINKIASFSATALIYVDGGRAMGAAAASFAIAPLGAGIATMIFRDKFKNDRALGVNATILGFMGISEGAIPFAAKYTWAAVIPNILCSGIAGMFAGIFGVSGWVGAWGGPIIAIFGGVTTYDMSYIGILYYLIAIAIGVACHVVLFRALVEVQTNQGKFGSVKAAHVQYVNTVTNKYISDKQAQLEKIDNLESTMRTEVGKAKVEGKDTKAIKELYKQQIADCKKQIKDLKANKKVKITKAKEAYKKYVKLEKDMVKNHTGEIKNYSTGQKEILNQELNKHSADMKKTKEIENKFKRKEARNDISSLKHNAKKQFKYNNEVFESKYKTNYVKQYEVDIR